MYTYLYSGEGFIFCVVVRFTPTPHPEGVNTDTMEYQLSVKKKKELSFFSSLFFRRGLHLWCRCRSHRMGVSVERYKIQRK